MTSLSALATLFAGTALLAASLSSATETSAAADFFAGSASRPDAAGFGLDDTARGTEDFLPVEQAFRASLQETDDYFTLRWTIAPDYYLYKRQFRLRDSEGRELDAALGFSRAIQTYDGYFGRVGVYYHSATVLIDRSVIHNAGSSGKGLQLSYQGCAEAGLCYPEQSFPLTLP